MEWEELKGRVNTCVRCLLHKTKIKHVFGEGNKNADIVFVAEAPGANEDKTGRPFVGRAGEVLNELLESISLRRKDIFICNILKCRPPKNRNPLPEEIELCTPYLDLQLQYIKPKVICTLGNFATEYIMKRYNLGAQVNTISKIHGRVFVAVTLFNTIKIIPLYHPAVVTYQPTMLPILLKDIKVVGETVGTRK